MNKIGLIIPCYNVQKSINTILKTVKNYNIINIINKIVIIDNNSNYNNIKIIKNHKSKNKKLILIKNKFNFGYGGSIKVATNYLIKKGFSHAIIVHSDDQINISKVLKDFFDVFDNTKPEFILSSRFYQNNLKLTKNYKIQRRLANLIFSFFYRNLINYKYTDIGSGIIFFSLQRIKRLKFMELDNDMLFHVQLNILANELIKDSAEIELHWRDSKIKSNTNDYKIGIQLIYILLFYIFKKKIFLKSIFDSIPFKKKYIFSKKYLIEK